MEMDRDRNSVTKDGIDAAWLERKVFGQRLQVFTERSISGALASFLGTTLLAWIEYPVSGAAAALAWLALIFPVEFAIIGWGFWYQRRGFDPASPWTRVYTELVCSLLLGLAWGASVWFFHAPASFFHYLFNLTVLATVTALTLTIVAPFARCTWLFTLGILLPIGLHAWLEPNPFSVQIAVALVVLFLVQLRYAAQARAQLITSLENALRSEFLAEKLRLNQRQMLISQEISNTGTWVYNPQTRRVWGSAQALRIFGYSDRAEEIPLEEIESHFMEQELVHRSLMELVEQGKEYDIEYTLKPVDGGSARHVRSIAILDRGQPDGATLVLGFIQDVTASKALEAQVRRLAFYDGLTKLANRHLLADRLQQAVHAHTRASSFGALLFLDLDNFKPLNDRHGHSIGDILLVQVGSRLKACVRQVDTVARFGGDEFVVLLTDVGGDQAEVRSHALAVAEKIRVVVSEPYEIPPLDETLAQPLIHECTVSIGGAVFGAHHGRIDELVQRADAAMYKAKELGRNQIWFDR